MLFSRRIPICALLALAFSLPGQQDEARPYFSLSSSRTFAPGEKATIQMWAQNVRSLEFRVYRINDPVLFFRRLDDTHRFGGQAPRVPRELTPLERFHDFKRRCRNWARDLVRAQYAPPLRAGIRTWMEERKQQKVAGHNAYAEVPVLNPQQVVAVWQQSVSTGRRWESQTVPIPTPGKGLYLVEAVHAGYRAYTVILASDIAIVTKSAPGRLVARVVDRRTGAPLARCPLLVLAKTKELAHPATDQQGLADLKIDEARPEEVLVLARTRDDFAVSSLYGWNLSSDAERWLSGYVYTDRPVYRPGHQVNFKAILRTQLHTEYRLPERGELQAEIQNAEGQPVYRKTLAISGYGTVASDFTLPADAALGYYSIDLRMGEAHANGGFQVEEYKKPEYEVRVVAEKRRVLLGETVPVSIEARYYYGEPVANAKVVWSVYRSRYWGPWYDDEGDQQEEGEEDSSGRQNEQTQEQSGQLDASGKLTVEIPAAPAGFDTTLRIEAKVTDQGNREISGTGWALATVGSFLVNIEPEQYVYQPGDLARLRVQARDYDGHPVETDFKVEMGEWRGGKSEEFTPSFTARGRTDSQGAATVQAPLAKAGSWVAQVTASTPERRMVRDRAHLWVSGGAVWQGERQERLQMIPDKRSYKVGETARVLILTGVPDAHILVATEGREIHTVRTVEAHGPTVTVEVPILPAYAPNFYLSAAFLRGNQYYEGSKSIRVPATDKQLKVAVTPSKKQFRPGEPGEYSIEASDSAGRPVAAEFSLGVVDEAIYAIRRESVKDIASYFYGSIYNLVNTSSSLSYYFQGEAGKRKMMLAQLRSPALAQIKPERLVMPKVRKAFPDTALWLANVTTDASGHARARLTFPDALTTWRATARGVTRDTKVGSAVQKTIVRKNLILSLAVPRFFTQGDEVVISGIVHNYLAGEKTVRMSLEVTGLEILQGATRDVTVASRGEAKVDWRVKALPGREARLLGKALTDEESDAMELTLPVMPHGVKLSESRAGSLAEGSAETSAEIKFPARIVPSSRALEIRVAPSIGGAIFGALDFLTSYPYGCTEQTMSSFLPNVVVAQAVKDLKLKTYIDEKALQKKIHAGLERLYEFQHPDGGWGWWQTDDSQLFMTGYVVSGLAQAKAAGYEVKDEAYQKAAQWLSAETQKNPRAAADLAAYVFYALSLAGNRDAALREGLWGRRKEMSPYGAALLGLALDLAGDGRAGEIAAQLESQAKITGPEAYWKVDRDDLMDFYGDTSPEATAYALKLLTHFKPQSPLLAAAALWLVNHRDQGYYWFSTKQTAMVIFGLTDYLKVSGELNPDFSAVVTVNGKPVLTRHFTAADAVSATPPVIRLAAGELAEQVNQIKISKKGAGRLYWSARGDYYSTEPKLARTGSVQLNLLREYFRLAPARESDKIVYRFGNLEGPLKPGDIVAVRLTLTGGDWRYLLIEDPIPAGTEFIQREDLYEIKDKPSWWGYWFTRREFHDDRAAIFQTWFSQGQQQYVYLLKVVNPGRFLVSPARVEPMYQPQYLATTESKILEVQ